MLELLDPVGSIAQALAGRLADASFALLAVAVALHAAKLTARARAWHNIARAAYPDERLRFRHSLGAYFCAAGTNALLPARPGELLKLALVRRKAPGTAYQGLASTLLTESVFDSVVGALAVVAAIGLGWGLGGSVPAPVAFVAGHPWLMGAVTAIALGGGWLLRRPVGLRLKKLTVGASRGFRVLHRPGQYARTVVSWQIAALGLRVASILCFLAAFHVPATIQTTFLVLAVQSLANLVPLTPNGAGTQQALLVMALGASAGAASVVGFGAGAQLATVLADVVLAVVSLVLMTGSLRWRGLLVQEQPAPTLP